MSRKPPPIAPKPPRLSKTPVHLDVNAGCAAFPTPPAPAAPQSTQSVKPELQHHDEATEAKCLPTSTSLVTESSQILNESERQHTLYSNYTELIAKHEADITQAAESNALRSNAQESLVSHTFVQSILIQYILEYSYSIVTSFISLHSRLADYYYVPLKIPFSLSLPIIGRKRKSVYLVAIPLSLK